MEPASAAFFRLLPLFSFLSEVNLSAPPFAGLFCDLSFDKFIPSSDCLAWRNVSFGVFYLVLLQDVFEV